MIETPASAKIWKLLTVVSSVVAMLALLLAGMLYTRKGIGDVFWPEEKIINTARTTLLKMERDTSLVTTRAYVQAVVRQRNEAWYGDAEVIRIVPATINYAVNLGEIDYGRMVFDEKKHELQVPLPDVKILSIDPNLAKAEVIRNLDFLRMESTTGNQLEDTTEQMIRPEIEKLGQSPEIIKTAKEHAISSVRQLLESALSSVGQPIAVQPYFKNDGQTTTQSEKQ
ncbi:MAG TPA: DUF4230 domain-containing protein [Blastocatellia bacterium]|nr:DUF4230 domain-containing protein [Blastocatellia bacterium]